MPTPDATPLAIATAEIAQGFLGVREHPAGSNRGPEIDGFLTSVGLDPTKGKYAWCAAFVSNCVREAALRVGGPPQFRGGAGALGLLAKNRNLVMEAPEALPCVFVIDHGGGRGHCGFVLELLDGGRMLTCEGNTGPGPAAPAQDREGDGVYMRRDRQIADCAGFVRIG